MAELRRRHEPDYERGHGGSAAENAQRIKRFALWLMAAAAASNLAAWGFAAVLDGHGLFGADVPQTLVAGAMIYVIGYVMDLGRAADLERKGYI